MRDKPQLWIVAGPNGAGKTTSVKLEPIATLVSNVKFLNPDAVTLECLNKAGYAGFKDAPLDVQTRLFIQSANAVQAELESRLDRSESVGIETVLSTEKYLSLCDRVRLNGGEVSLLYVGVSSPEISMHRVAKRVQAGGHGIPDDKIVARYHRSLALLPEFISRTTQFWIYDNSDANPENPPLVVASGSLGRLGFQHPEIFPELQDVLSRIPRM